MQIRKLHGYDKKWKALTAGLYIFREERAQKNRPTIAA